MKADQPNAAQLEAHQCHKDRLKRIAAKAVKEVVPVEVVEVVAPVELEKRVEAAAEGPMPWVAMFAEETVTETLAMQPEIAEAPIKPPSVESILAACARHFGLTRIDLNSARRTQDVAVPRQIAMYLAKTLTLNSLPQIGRRLGGRDHSTILYGVRKIARLIRSDSDLAFDVAHIELSLEAA